MDEYGRGNRANQLNPNHKSTGPGRSAGYHGSGTKADLDNHSRQLGGRTNLGYGGTGTKSDLDNHSNQLNPNNERYARNN